MSLLYFNISIYQANLCRALYLGEQFIALTRKVNVTVFHIRVQRQLNYMFLPIRGCTEDVLLKFSVFIIFSCFFFYKPDHISNIFFLFPFPVNFSQPSCFRQCWSLWSWWICLQQWGRTQNFDDRKMEWIYELSTLWFGRRTPARQHFERGYIQLSSSIINLSAMQHFFPLFI